MNFELRTSNFELSDYEAGAVPGVRRFSTGLFSGYFGNV